jgi:hypothetical protein
MHVHCDGAKILIFFLEFLNKSWIMFLAFTMLNVLSEPAIKNITQKATSSDWWVMFCPEQSQILVSSFMDRPQLHRADGKSSYSRIDTSKNLPIKSYRECVREHGPPSIAWDSNKGLVWPITAFVSVIPWWLQYPCSLIHLWNGMTNFSGHVETSERWECFQDIRLKNIWSFEEKKTGMSVATKRLEINFYFTSIYFGLTIGGYLL